MKANKFANAQDDEAVSPVIAVILMVAITVVLAATVYVWVSGFGTSGSIKKFPQVTLKDHDGSTSPFAASHALATLEHRGGDTVNWDDYTVNIFRGGTQIVAGAANLQFTTTLALSSEACQATLVIAPTGAFAVGNKIHICEGTTAAWAAGNEMKVQVIDENQNSIVYENTVVLS